ncbi:hypothetical protein AB835_04625 [Candidatus Endobugula sertula]|uniref:Enoyl-CoA hydratase n=1 Tax=Candidatus Endobugula sertula TaxID=62101 RepID=A0A1D2QRH1_9GAMM|nr:hypothetical protein AB835_04625 [Candidatus Endobugula sertula]
MVRVKVAFYKGKGNFIDWCIRFWTRSIYSHVEMIIITESTGDVCLVSSSGRDGGVRSKRIKADHFNKSNWTMIDVSKELLIEQLRPFYVDRMGLQYDFKGIFLSQFLPLKRHSKDKYFCSEFCAEALGFSQPHTYSPQGLYTALQQRG